MLELLITFFGLGLFTFGGGYAMISLIHKEVVEKKAEQPLDTETTFADMNVEGFSWYNPKKKKGKSEKVSVSKKEYRAMVRGAFAAMLPMFLCILSAFAIVFLLAYFWLKP